MRRSIRLWRKTSTLYQMYLPEYWDQDGFQTWISALCWRAYFLYYPTEIIDWPKETKMRRTQDTFSIARLGAKCLSAVSAYDNTLETVETDAANAKFDDILNSPSVEAACEKIKSLAKAEELDSSLILLINSVWAASAKASSTMKNEVKDIMYHIYKATKSSLKSMAPKEIKLLKYLLNITDPEQRFSALATAFSPGDDHEARHPTAIYTSCTSGLRSCLMHTN